MGCGTTLEFHLTYHPFKKYVKYIFSPRGLSMTSHPFSESDWSAWPYVISRSKHDVKSGTTKYMRISIFSCVTIRDITLNAWCQASYYEIYEDFYIFLSDHMWYHAQSITSSQVLQNIRGFLYFPVWPYVISRSKHDVKPGTLLKKKGSSGRNLEPWGSRRWNMEPKDTKKWI